MTKTGFCVHILGLFQSRLYPSKKHKKTGDRVSGLFCDTNMKLNLGTIGRSWYFADQNSSSLRASCRCH